MPEWLPGTYAGAPCERTNRSFWPGVCDIKTCWASFNHPHSTEGRCVTLVLTREVDQKITIGDDVVITVLKIEGGKVRLGINAPDALRIMRDNAVRVVRRELNEGRDAA